MAARRAKFSPQYTKTIAYREALTHCLLSHENLLPLAGVFVHRGSFTSLIPLVTNRYSSQPCNSSLFSSASSLHYLKSTAEASSDDLLVISLKILQGVARGVEYMHSFSSPVIHGDLHPENILITEDGNALICDFGLSRIHHEVTRTATNIQQGGHRRYAAPELINSPDDRFRTSKASDIYSLGMTFYSLVTLDLPFRDYWDYDAMSRILQGERPPRPVAMSLSAFPDIEALLWDMIEHMWAPKPPSRPSAAAVLERCERAVATLQLTGLPEFLS
ncbi:kinase-like protein [Clavulina sp. PMI_390]|nr:kinase-like protein [Clavulina sp. PMI_390]